MVHLSRPGPDNGHFSTDEVRQNPGAPPSVSTSRLIAFPKDHYRQPPNLAAGFTHLHISHEGPIRANLIADRITREIFRIAIETWGNSTLYSAAATWIEHAATARECIFGQFDTQDAAQAPVKSASAPKASVTVKHTIQTDPVPKKYAKSFSFPRPFKEPPEVVCWLNRLDLASGRNKDYKVRAFADGIDRKCATAHLNTWDDGEMRGAAMCWIAFPKSKKHVDFGRISTNDVRKRTQPRERTSGKVKFKQKFPVKPTVLCALSTIDAAGNADLRCSVKVSEVDREGFRWAIEGGGKSTVYAAGASWIALGSP